MGLVAQGARLNRPWRILHRGHDGLVLLTEKQEGTFRRLLVAPLRKSILLAGKMLPYYLDNLIQVAVMFGVAFPL